ncbi:MAG: hypothetical protein OXU26_03390 [Acidobacteriota bacterium]|nr:hypothetical protein [Acidobacteriota bacterium]
MQLSRSRDPSGQGGFKAGCLEWAGEDGRPRTFRYISYCGPDAGEGALQEAINELAPQHKRMDALFLSRLDRDRVNGIDWLSGQVAIDTVVIPHAGPGAIIADLLAAKVRGTLSGTLAEARLNPELWFGRRGVLRVVRVNAVPGRGSSGGAAVGTASDGDQPGAGRCVLDGDAGFARFAGPRAAARIIESGTAISPAGASWDFVPRADPRPDGASLFEFELCARSVMGLGNRRRIGAQRLLEALTCRTTLEDLGCYYDFHYPARGISKHDCASMSVCSGSAAGARPEWNSRGDGQGVWQVNSHSSMKRLT